MGAVIQQNAAPAHLAPAPPRGRSGRGPAIGDRAVDLELGQVPPADHALVEPGPELEPGGVVPVLVTGHHYPAPGAGQGRNLAYLGPRQRHRLLTEHVTAGLQAPEGELHVARGRGADVDEVDRLALPVSSLLHRVAEGLEVGKAREGLDMGR